MPIEKQAEMHYTAGLDIGNGYVKGLIGLNESAAPVTNRTTVFSDTATVPTDVVDLPSVATVMVRNNVPATPDNEAMAVVTAGTGSRPGNDTREATDFFNSVAAIFHSPMIESTDRHVIGTRALTASGYTEDFAVSGSTDSKAEQSLSKVLVLSSIVAKAVKDYVIHHGELPGPGSTAAQMTGETALTVHATVALALPIGEYVRHKDNYAASFTGAAADTGGSVERTVHTVTVANFATNVTVNVIFDDVVVIAEGASAQYAISSAGEPLAHAMLAEVRGHESEPGELVDPELTGADIFAATNTVGVDIGEGTVNFPVFTGGAYNVDSSMTYNKGYGTVLESAIEDMESNNVRMFNSRKQLADFLLTEPTATKRQQHKKVKAFVDKQIDYFVGDMVQHFGRVLATVGAATEVVYVYGGGSGPMREQLGPMLARKVEEMTGFGGFPVLYLDAGYSRNLNREGLLIAATSVARANA